MKSNTTDTEKLCPICERWKVHGLFYKQEHRSRNLSAYCKNCTDKKNTLWKINNREKYNKRPSARPKYRRTYTRRRLYGLSEEEYQRKFEDQKGLCAIIDCGRPIRDTDHNHRTGRVRDLLCSPCNRALGLFHDNPQLLRNAANYLDRHEAM